MVLDARGRPRHVHAARERPCDITRKYDCIRYPALGRLFSRFLCLQHQPCMKLDSHLDTCADYHCEAALLAGVPADTNLGFF